MHLALLLFLLCMFFSLVFLASPCRFLHSIWFRKHEKIVPPVENSHVRATNTHTHTRRYELHERIHSDYYYYFFASSPNVCVVRTAASLFFFIFVVVRCVAFVHPIFIKMNRRHHKHRHTAIHSFIFLQIRVGARRR